MAAPSEEKLICDIFNLEAFTVNQVKSFKALADGKDVFIDITKKWWDRQNPSSCLTQCQTEKKSFQF
jgi:hypothetical protein